jgi:hypothetical protein
MLEVVACSNCGEHLISGERIEGNDGIDSFRMIRQIEEKTELFEIDSVAQNEDDDEEDYSSLNSNLRNINVIRTEKQKEIEYNDSFNVQELGINNDFSIDDDGTDYVEYSRIKEKDGIETRMSCCPSCLEVIT